MKHISLALLVAAGPLAGCRTTQAYMKMVDPACIAAPTGYVVRHDYPVVEDKIDGAAPSCPTILVPVEIAQAMPQSQSRSPATRVLGVREMGGSGQPASRPANHGGGHGKGPAPSVTVESSAAGGGKSLATKTTLSGPSAPTGRTPVVRAGRITINSDGSVDMPSGHYK
ncbi:hypothetical protein [Maritimibacter sp. DP1N21-5]|uniref:hypothetical protein n=1 Tax=Maritimibacter sp. DP1N21-5 TaxID=2836867 RepID=UPI001C476C02|nr:hypothetical protein [Maritimibacter sp. DP1N21-5]MBV7410602.1 hypothetical protein [Maritimibacter sp. DP1N21-5]